MQIVARLYYETDELFPEVLDRALIQFKSLLIDWVIPNWLAEHIHRIGKNSSIWYVHVCNVECTPFAILFHLFHGSNLWRQKRKILKLFSKAFLHCTFYRYISTCVIEKYSKETEWIVNKISYYDSGTFSNTLKIFQKNNNVITIVFLEKFDTFLAFFSEWNCYEFEVFE